MKRRQDGCCCRETKDRVRRAAVATTAGVEAEADLATDCRSKAETACAARRLTVGDMVCVCVSLVRLVFQKVVSITKNGRPICPIYGRCVDVRSEKCRWPFAQVSSPGTKPKREATLRMPQSAIPRAWHWGQLPEKPPESILNKTPLHTPTTDVSPVPVQPSELPPMLLPPLSRSIVLRSYVVLQYRISINMHV